MIHTSTLEKANNNNTKSERTSNCPRLRASTAPRPAIALNDSKDTRNKMQYQSPTSTKPQLTRSVTPSPKFERIQREKDDKLLTDNYGGSKLPRLIEKCKTAKELGKLMKLNGKIFKFIEPLQATLMKIDSLKDDMKSKDVALLLGIVSNSRFHKHHTVLYRAILTTLSDVALANLHQANAKDISMTLHSLAKRDVCNTELLHEAAEYGVCVMDDFTSEGLSNMLLALAKMGSYSFEFFDQAAKTIVPMIHDEDFNFTSLCFIADAFCRTKHYDPELFSALAQKAIPYLDTFKRQHLILLIDSFANSPHDCQELFDATSNVIIEKVEYFNTVDLASLSNSFAKYGYKNPNVLNVIAEKEIPFMHTLEAKSLAQLVLAFVEMDHFHEDLFKAAKVTAMHRMTAYEASEIVTIAIAFSKLKYDMHPVFTVAAEAAELVLDDLEPKGIAKLLDVISRMGSFSESTDHLFCSIASRILSNPFEMTRWESRYLVDVAMAFAKGGVMNSKLIDAIGKTILKRGDVFPANGVKLQRLLAAFPGYETRSAIRVMELVFRQFMSLDKNDIKFSLVMDIAMALPVGHRYDILPFGILNLISDLALDQGTKEEVFTIFEQFAKVGFDGTESPKHGRKLGKKVY